MIAWLVVVLYAFPGQMCPDTFDHLGEARTGVYTDSHPPAINALFWIAEQVASVPLILCIGQTLLLLIALDRLCCRSLPRDRAARLAAAIFVAPPVFVTMAVVWKDGLLPGLLVLGLHGLLDDRRAVRVGGLAALAGATAIRYNAFAATFPLIVLLFEWQRGASWWRRYPIAVAAWLATSGAAFALNAQLTDREMHYWHSSVALHDIVGTYAHRDDDVSDRELAERLAGTQLISEHDIHATLRANYHRDNFFWLIGGNHPVWRVAIFEPMPASQQAAIERAWRATISESPGAYLRHRVDVMSAVLAWGKLGNRSAILGRDYEYKVNAIAAGMSTRPSWLQRAVSQRLASIGRWVPMFAPWLYLALALIALPIVRRHRDLFALVASGIALESSLVVLAPTPDYRYSHWMILATILAIALYVARWAQSRVTRSESAK